MSGHNLKSLVERMSDQARRALEAAAVDAATRTNHAIEIEHWITAILQDNTSEFRVALQAAGADLVRIGAEANRSIGRLPGGCAKPPTVSQEFFDWLKASLVVASLRGPDALISSGVMLLAALDNQDQRRAVEGVCEGFEDLVADRVRQVVAAAKPESRRDAAGSRPGHADGDASSAAASEGSGGMLSKYAIDLTAMARQGKIAPVVGRDAEMIQIEQTLLKHSQNNPILLGDPGVGKTAVVEGFASRIVAGECPEALRDVALMSLDIGGMMAGAGVRGEFESRLKGIIHDVRASQRPIVLFIDEIHNLIGAGNQAGVGDAANLLKPALARGELRTIGATTWAEYKKHVEKDPALVRRFSPVKILEPREEDARIMIRAVAGVLEKHHKVTVLEEAVDASVRLSKRYIPERQLPDKARSLLDTACAAVSMSQSAVPRTVQDARRRLQLIKAQRDKLEREAAGGMDRTDRIAEVDREFEAATARAAELEQRWKSELDLLSGIRSAAAGPEAGRPADASRGAVISELRGRLRAMQGDAPMVHELVDADAIARTVSEWTGIPAGRMAAGQAELLQSLESRLASRIIGQPDAMVEIARSLRTTSADLGDPRKPRGVFFLVGPSGVGKTETAVAIAELLYGGRQAMTAVNLSEFQEDHKVATLLGPPPGYVGADEGGILTEAARRRPYSVILLDEAEKAKPAVNNIFLKLFDEGSLSDGMGRLVDFRNTTIFVTSNVGSSAIVDRCNKPGAPPDHDELKKLIEPELLKHFRDEYLKRMALIVYRPLSPDVVARVVQLRLDSLVGRVRAAYGAELAFESEVVPRLASRCVATQSGARVVEQVISRSIQADLAAALLGRTDADAKISRILVRAADDGTFKYDFQ